MSLKSLELIILAALAAVVLYQLYAVLGRRVGRGSEEAARARAASTPAPSAAPPRANTPAPAPGLAALTAQDPSFDVDHFMVGARAAYQMIVTAFAAGDRGVLKPLLAPSVMAGFEAAMSQRESEGRTESVEFLHPPRSDFEGVALKEDRVQASVRFLAEFRSRAKGPEGETVDDRRTAEVWTFERSLKARDPNWFLIHVDPAEA